VGVGRNSVPLVSLKCMTNLFDVFLFLPFVFGAIGLSKIQFNRSLMLIFMGFIEGLIRLLVMVYSAYLYNISFYFSDPRGGGSGRSRGFMVLVFNK